MSQTDSSINWEVIDSLADDQDSKTVLLNSFIQSFESDLANFVNAIGVNDHEKILIVTHTLKGAASNFCSPSLVKELKELEAQYIKGSFDNLAQDSEVITKIVTRITEELKSRL